MHKALHPKWPYGIQVLMTGWYSATCELNIPTEEALAMRQFPPQVCAVQLCVLTFMIIMMLPAHHFHNCTWHTDHDRK